MVAAKEVVGEQYHIHGFGLGSAFARGTDRELNSGKAAVHFRPSQEV